MKFVLKELKNTFTITGIVNLHFFEFPKDFYTKSDSHPFYELVYVSSGSLYINSDFYNGILEKGKMIVHTPNEKHSLLCENGSNPTVIILGFTCSNDSISKFSKSPILLSVSDVKKLAEIVKEGRNVFEPPYDVPVYNMKTRKNSILGSEQMLKILLEYFFIGVLREFNDSNVSDENNLPEKFSVSEITNYLDNNYKEKISIDELSFIFRTNRSTLCKEFKNATGKTIVEYLNQIKLNISKEKILNSNKTLTEIAEELNFESIHYFTRFFKKKTGLSPKEFRNQNKL